jgi:hypothetical protein
MMFFSSIYRVGYVIAIILFELFVPNIIYLIKDNLQGKSGECYNYGNIYNDNPERIGLDFANLGHSN